MLSNGNVMGVFQLEGSAGIREAVKQMQPDRIIRYHRTYVAVCIRPMENIPTYVAQTWNRELMPFILIPKEILSEDLGIIVYQEQVIKLLRFWLDIVWRSRYFASCQKAKRATFCICYQLKGLSEIHAEYF